MQKYYPRTFDVSTTICKRDFEMPKYYSEIKKLNVLL